MAGILALCVLPFYLALAGPLDIGETALFAWLASPLALAVFVSRTGRIELATSISLYMTALFLAGLCIATGGLQSIVLLWFCILPIESALFGGTRSVVSGLCAALLGFALVAISSFLPVDLAFETVLAGEGTTYQLSVFAVLLYATLLAYRIERRRQISSDRFGAQESRFRLLADNSTDLITRHNTAGATLFASPATQTLFGTTSDDLLGSGFLEQIHLHDRVAFLNTFSQTVRLKQEQRCQFRIRCEADGETSHKWLEMRCRPVVGQDGEVTDIVAVSRDVSEAKDHERTLDEARRLAEASNEAKRRFLANISHELRTPLNAIIGFSDMLKQELFGSLPHAKQAEYVGHIHDSSTHLLTVVNDLLDMSKIEAGKYDLVIEPFSLADVAARSCAMLGPLVESRKLVLDQHVGADLPEISGDRRACQQILINLITNAVKFTPAGGRVSLTAEKSGRTVRISVKDTGIGIPKDKIAGLGKPFVQVSQSHAREHEGTGLGLSVVKGLVDLHGGRLQIDSVEGAGTTISVTLPIDCPRPVPGDATKTLVDLKAHRDAREETPEDGGKRVTGKSRSKSHARISA